MSLVEQETIITFNDQDMKDGYFTFGTSKAVAWAKLCRRVGDEKNLIDVEKSTFGGRVTYYKGKVPLKYLGAYWGIGNGVKRVLSPERIEETKRRFEMARKAKEAKC